MAQLKLTDCRTEIERLKGELRILKKNNKKLQLRVQTFEKKIELEQVKKRTLSNQLENTADEFEQIKIERDTYFSLVFDHRLIFKMRRKKNVFIVSSKRQKRKKKNLVKYEIKWLKINKNWSNLKNVLKIIETKIEIEPMNFQNRKLIDIFSVHFWWNSSILSF